MKKIIIIPLLVCLALFSGCSTKLASSTQDTNSIIVIDAGHGGKDAGTIGIDGCLEKVINLSISLNLYDFLMVSGIDTKLIRNGDYEFYKQGEGRTKSDLYNRLDFVNSINSSMLISIHQNHYENEAEWGTQIWYSANTPKSKVLADNILFEVISNLQPENKRINKESGSDYYILHKATVPSIMIECGFMSNREENKKLQNEKYQKEFAFCILSGISEEI